MNYKAKNWHLYFFLILSTNLIIFLSQQFLITKNVYYNTFQSQLDDTRIDQVFTDQARYFWFSYFFVTIWISIRIFFVNLCLQTGALIQNIKLKFGNTLRIVLVSEFVFLLPAIIKLCWFLLIKTDYTLPEMRDFYPLSALNLFNRKDLAPVLIYPLQTFNLFEIAYWMLLAVGIRKALKSDFDSGLKVVLCGYIPALVLWMLCIMFITISLSPAT